MKKQPSHILLAGALLIGNLGATTMGQNSDALLNKLVQKGILTDKEAADLKQEASKATPPPSIGPKSSMSDWIEKIKFSGDFRGRYDGIFQDNSNNPVNDRNRLRYRLRFGATMAMSDHFEVGMRLASGDPVSVGGAIQPFGGNINSANTTLNGDGARKWIWVDTAYAKWSPKDWFQAQFGKMDSTFWMTDAVIDYDYQPEGGQERLTYDINDAHKIGLTSGQWVIAENYSNPGNNADTYLFINQLDWTAKWNSKISSRLGVASLNFKNQGNISKALEDYVGAIQNGPPASGAGAVNFNPVVARGELTYTLDSFPLFHGAFPITVGGEYFNNTAVNVDHEGYNLGVAFGSVKKKGNWQIAYNYKNIEANSTWRGLEDDDFGYNAKGGTDVRGHHIKAWYRPFDPMTIVLSYFITEQINNPVGGFRPQQQRIFLDLVWAF